MRRRVLADETQFYASPYLSSLANLDKGDFKGVFVGNPIGEGDPDRIHELSHVRNVASRTTGSDPKPAEPRPKGKLLPSRSRNKPEKLQA